MMSVKDGDFTKTVVIDDKQVTGVNALIRLE